MDNILTIAIKTKLTSMRRKEGFEGQRAILLPAAAIAELSTHRLTATLYTTDIGFYPAATGHYRERSKGCMQNILIYCTEGKGWFQAENIHYSIEKNHFFVIPAHMPHRYGAHHEQPWTIYWLHFGGECAGHFFGNRPFKGELINSEFNRTDDRLQLFEQLYSNLESGFNPENMEYSTTALWHLLGSFRYTVPFSRIRTKEQGDVIEKSIQLMQNTLRDDVTLNELAAAAKLSVSHYSLIFKRKTGYSPLDYLIHLRIRRACHLLDFTNMKINEIARNTGYHDPFYFSRVFTKIMGISPLYYRRKLKG